MDYIMGLCCADSVTTVNIASVTGVVMQHFTVGAINLFLGDEQQAGHSLAEAFVTAQMAGYPVASCRQVCAGIAGFGSVEGNLKLGPALRNVMRRCGYEGDALLVGDEQITLAGALEGKKGAVLLADNASMCFGKNTAGAQYRTGGLGRLADDDGSAYAIGREVLRAVARASDGRGPVTRLTAQVYQKFRLIGPDSLVRLLRTGAPTDEEICELGAGLPQACQAQDKVALQIVDKVVEQLSSLVEPVVNRLMMKKGVLAVAGRVLLNDAYVGIAFKKRMAELFPELQCVPPRSDGAAGAVLLAKERLALRGRFGA